MAKVLVWGMALWPGFPLLGEDWHLPQTVWAEGLKLPLPEPETSGRTASQCGALPPRIPPSASSSGAGGNSRAGRPGLNPSPFWSQLCDLEHGLSLLYLNWLIWEQEVQLPPSPCTLR